MVTPKIYFMFSNCFEAVQLSHPTIQNSGSSLRVLDYNTANTAFNPMGNCFFFFFDPYFNQQAKIKLPINTSGRSTWWCLAYIEQSTLHNKFYGKICEVLYSNEKFPQQNCFNFLVSVFNMKFSPNIKSTQEFILLEYDSF